MVTCAILAVQAIPDQLWWLVANVHLIPLRSYLNIHCMWRECDYVIPLYEMDASSTQQRIQRGASGKQHRKQKKKTNVLVEFVQVTAVSHVRPQAAPPHMNTPRHIFLHNYINYKLSHTFQFNGVFLMISHMRILSRAAKLTCLYVRVSFNSRSLKVSFLDFPVFLQHPEATRTEQPSPIVWHFASKTSYHKGTPSRVRPSIV